MAAEYCQIIQTVWTLEQEDRGWGGPVRYPSWNGTLNIENALGFSGAHIQLCV